VTPLETTPLETKQAVLRDLQNQLDAAVMGEPIHTAELARTVLHALIYLVEHTDG
jgi:hypothetical protein